MCEGTWWVSEQWAGRCVMSFDTPPMHSRVLDACSSEAVAVCVKSCTAECTSPQHCTLVMCPGEGGVHASLFHLPDSLRGLCLELSELPC